MKRKTLKVLIGFIAFTIGLVSTAFWVFSLPDTLANVANIQNEKITDEDYAVYSTLIKKLIIRENSSAESINISNQVPFLESGFQIIEGESQSETSTTDVYIQDLKKRYPTVDKDTLSDFVTKQNPPIELQPKFNLPVKYNLIDEKKVKENEGRASKQIISFSQVGFNKTKTQAFVRIEYYCALCGFGSHILLEKQNGVWQIKDEFSAWMS
ncbi:MAG: hypothetical protein M3405_01565 [Acidobacteriota bacterium]|jgi:hypothetical protein|nr:hypothetical protein [Acidobacteriota bacterium]